MQSASEPDAVSGVPLWRRLAAALYDGMIVLALWFIGTALVMPLSRAAVAPDHPLAELIYRLYLLAIGSLHAIASAIFLAVISPRSGDPFWTAAAEDVRRVWITSEQGSQGKRS